MLEYLKMLEKCLEHMETFEKKILIAHDNKKKKKEKIYVW